MLEVDKAGKTYTGKDKTVKAITDISFSAERGELLCVQGPSGAGKSTLLLMCGGLLSPTTGTIRVNGVDLYALSPAERTAFRAAHMGFIFQQFHLVPYLTVLQNVLVPSVPRPRPDARERAEELVDRFGLGHRMNHLPSELSVGEKQRTALARALFNEPALLLADEPTGNLDPENGAFVLTTLKEYAEQEEKTVLLVTHDPAGAEYARRVIRLENGRIVE